MNVQNRVVEAPLIENPLVDNPNSDIVDHETMFQNFVRLFAIGSFHVATVLVGLGIGGVEGHWFLAGFWIVVGTIAAVVGAVTALEWRPGAVVLALSALTLALAG